MVLKYSNILRINLKINPILQLLDPLNQKQNFPGKCSMLFLLLVFPLYSSVFFFLELTLD